MSTLPILFSFFDSESIVNHIHQALNYEIGKLQIHEFPDQEIVVKIESDLTMRDIIFVASLDHPNAKILPLIFAAETVRNLGAKKIMLIAPYLAYMRQDKIFEAGQGIIAQYFAKMLSQYFDSLITIDPHLHRIHSLKEIFSIPTAVLHATNAIASWISHQVVNPVLIGPDMESAQWVHEVAKKTNSPYVILNKIRKNDYTVEISENNIEHYRACIPILIDDIISSGMTLIETTKHLESLKMKKPICIGVHAIFSGDAYPHLMNAYVSKVVTCNTIQHPSNAIDISDEIIQFLKKEQTQLG